MARQTSALACEHIVLLMDRDRRRGLSRADYAIEGAGHGGRVLTQVARFVRPAARAQARAWPHSCGVSRRASSGYSRARCAGRY